MWYPGRARECPSSKNVFRGVITLVNELAILCDRMGIDVWEVVQQQHTKPFGFMPFCPVPDWGHCMPIGPVLPLLARAILERYEELAGGISINMPHYAVSRIAAALNREKAGKWQPGLILG